MGKVRNRIDLYDEISLRLKWGKSKTKGNKLGSRLKRVVKCRHWVYAELMERWQRSPFDNPIKTKRY